MIENEPPSKTPDPVAPRQGTARNRAIWRLAIAVFVLLVAFGGLRLWCIDGLLRRVVIDGPSMAPAFCGAHYDVQCGDCGFPFRCDAEHVPSDGKVACPNCGFTDNLLRDARRMSAERVVIDRWPLLFRRPERGDVIAFRPPGSSGELAIKRIAALPGERLAIRGGDLYIDNILVRKSLAEWRAARMLVHDNNYQPQKTTSLPPRWRTGADPVWQTARTGFRFKLPTVSSFFVSLEGMWLTYENWSCTANSQLRGVAAPVRDNDSYNQGELGRSLNEVRDVAVSFDVHGPLDSTLMLEVRDGGEQFQVTIQESQAEFRVGQNSGWRAPLTADLSKGVAVEFGLVDQQWFLAIDGKTVSCQAYERRPDEGADTDKLASEAPFVLAIGGYDRELAITNLKVWRDVYYLDPSGLSRDWQAERPLAADEYALLGDNQPVSVDSRQWPGEGVARSAILGLVRKKKR